MTGELCCLAKRVSTTKQDEISQDRALNSHVEMHGYTVARPAVVMHGKSATKGEQAPYLAEMLEEVRLGKYTVIVFHDLSRQERRGILDTLKFVDDVRKAGGRVEFADQAWLDTLGPNADVNIANTAHAIKMESDTRTRKTAEGIAVVDANGAVRFMPPWGVQIVGKKYNKRFEAKPEGVQWVPFIFERVASGETLKETHAKIPDGVISLSTLTQLVRNEKYMGIVKDKSGRILHRWYGPDGNPGIVDAALWKRANDALSDRGRVRRGPRETKALLAGVLDCGICGTRMYRSKGTKNNNGVPVYSYYQCRYGKCKPAYSVKLSDVEALATQIMSGLTRKITKVEFVAGVNHDSEIEAVKRELRDLASQGLPEDAEDSKRAELRAERKRLESLPTIPDRWEETETDETYAQHWNSLSVAERGNWLRKSGVRMKVARDTSNVANLVEAAQSGMRAAGSAGYGLVLTAYLGPKL